MTRTLIITSVCILMACPAHLQAADPAGQKPAPAAKRSAPKALAVGERLQNSVRNFTFNGTFTGALQKIAETVGVRFAVDWRALGELKVWKHTPVTLKADSARGDQLLDMLLVKVAPMRKPLGWYASGGTICVTTQQRALAKTWEKAVAGVTNRRKVLQSINFQKAPLNAVVAFFRDLTGANFYVNWKALAQLGVTRESPVSLKLDGVAASSALDLIVEQLTSNDDNINRVHWVIDEGIVVISTGAALNVRLKTRTYDVADLMTQSITVGIGSAKMSMAKPSTNRRRNNNSNTSTETNVTDTGSSVSVNTAANKATREGLIDIIKNSIGDDMWEPSGRGSISIVRNQLIVTQTPLGFKLLDKSFKKH